jgi:hypothetical protein
MGLTPRQAATSTPRPRRLRTAGERVVAAALHPTHEQESPDWLKASGIVGALTVPIIIGALLQGMGIPLFWPIYVASVAAMVWFFWRVRDQPALVVSAFVFWAAIHKLVLAALVPAVTAQSASWLQNYKELMYPTIFGVGVGAAAIRTLAKRTGLLAALRRLTWPDWLAISVVVLVTIYFLISFALDSSQLTSQLIYARRFASLPIIFLAGRLLPPSLDQLRRSLRYLVGLAILVAAFGIVERLILGDSFWTDYLNVSHMRTSLVDEGFVSSRSHLINEMPANWFAFVDGTVVRRLVSTFLEPTTLALFLAFAIAVGLFAMPEWRAGRRAGWAIAMSILTIALILTIGKGGYLALVIMGVVVLLSASRSNALLILLLSIAIAGVGLIVGQFLPIATNLDRHVAGLLSGLLNVLTDPLGSGLGSTGFWGAQSRIGNDSTLGAVASQLGVLGAALFYGWFASAAWILLPANPTDRQPLQRVMAGGLLALMVVGVFSNSATGLLAGSFFVLFAGWTMTTSASSRQQSDRP